MHSEIHVLTICHKLSFQIDYQTICEVCLLRFQVAFGSDFHQFDAEKFTPFNEEFETALKGLRTQFEKPWHVVIA